MNKKQLHDYLRTCGRKQRFTSEEAAHEAIRDLESRPDRPERPLAAYYCTFCYGIHIGRKSKADVERENNGRRRT